ncbi:MAG: adenylyltransferase/cytidyltransferase family protein, partial [archaeon]|nr:adenylyltransferase/cytidyltransferase family protein [archaeon]
MKVAVAGTFNVIHAGHVALFNRAFELGSEIFIGLTSDTMASSSRSDYLPFHLRRNALEQRLARYGKPYTIFEINDIYGPPELMDDVATLIVSPETEAD